MSTGGIIGGIVGGITGFIIGGPLGAIYGAGMGFSAGMILDPITPDEPSLGSPDPNEIIMHNDVGRVIPDVLGIVSLTGNLLIYGNEYVVPITETVEVGKGGGDSQTHITGYEYYMSWGIGICVGEVRTLHAVYKGEDVVWEGFLSVDSASYGKETIELKGMGECTFYFGTDDQLNDSTITSILEDSTLQSPMRHLCYAVMKDCKIGSIDRVPTMHFVVSRFPVFDFSTRNKVGYDYNPIHAIWYVLVNLCGLPEEWICADTFTSNAKTISIDGITGVSLAFKTNQSALSYLTSLTEHSDSILYYGSDGKFHSKLFRETYEISSLPLIDENVLMEEPKFNRDSWINTLNEVKIQYNELIGGTLYEPVYELFGIGFNNSYNIGVGDYIYRDSFSLITFHTKFKQVSGGITHSCAISEDNDLYGWGIHDSTYGPLGLGDDQVYLLEPIKLFPGVKFVYVNCGRTYTIAIDVDGDFWGAGDNRFGQLGLGEGNPYIKNWTKIFIDGSSGVAAAVSMFHTIWMTGRGTYGSGQNGYGQTGIGFSGTSVFRPEPCTERATKVVCGGYFTAMSVSGSLYTVGKGFYGALGHFDWEKYDEGGFEYKDCEVFTNESELKKVEKVVGVNSLYAGLDNLYLNGRQSVGNGGLLGIGVLDSEDYPLQKTSRFHDLPGSYSSFVALNSSIYGLDSSGNFYAAGGSAYPGTPDLPQVTSLMSKQDIPGTYFHALYGMFSGPVLWASLQSISKETWSCATGDNSSRQLGTGDTARRYYFCSCYTKGEAVQFHSINSCDSVPHMICIGNTLMGCGVNDQGQLGTGDLLARLHFDYIETYGSPVYVSTSSASSFYIDSNSFAYATGRNSNYCLGLGDDTTRNLFTAISGSGWKMIKSNGSQFSIFVKTDGTVYGVGLNSVGQLGLDSDYSLQQNLVKLPIENIVQVSLGSGFTMVLDESGDLWASGRNTNGQLGLGDTTQRDVFTKTFENVVEINCGYAFSVLRTSDNYVFSTGYNTKGQLGNGTFSQSTNWGNVPFTKTAIKMSAGTDFAMALLIDGTVCGTGNNTYGQLGLGDSSINEVTTYTQDGFGNDQWLDIGCGSSFSVGIFQLEFQGAL